MRFICAAAVVSLLFAAHPASAQDTNTVLTTVVIPPPAVIVLAEPHGSAAPQRALLLSLYASNVGLQGYDAYSTLKALKLGATEANPLMKAMTKSTVGFAVIKAGMSAMTIATAERLWRNDQRGKAIAVVAFSNGIMALVAAHNYSVLQHANGGR